MTSSEPGVQKPDDLSRFPVLDKNALSHIMVVGNGQLGLLKELMSMFENDQQQRFDNLRKAVNSDDKEAIRDILHTIKGSAGTMGASRLAAAAGMLEAYGLGRLTATSAEELFKLLMRAYNEARMALIEYIDKYSRG